MTRVYLGLGANLGDRAANLDRARELLPPAVLLQKTSRVYESEPVGLTEQPLFLNQVVCGETELLPSALLSHLKEIECALDRQPSVKNGPRPIDLDLLFYGDWVYCADGLIVPHPRLGERSFVLAPLAEIEPGLIHPITGENIGRMWEEAEPRLAGSWVYR